MCDALSLTSSTKRKKRGEGRRKREEREGGRDGWREKGLKQYITQRSV
jgi:hypothetical protein